MNLVTELTRMPNEAKAGVLRGTLDLMVLQTLATLGPLHGYAIAARIEQASSDPARCLRQSRESAAGARHHAAARDRRPAGHGRWPRTRVANAG